MPSWMSGCWQSRDGERWAEECWTVARGGVTFVNADNDYPKRVRYWREGGELRAEISQLDGSDAMQFAFRPMNGE